MSIRHKKKLLCLIYKYVLLQLKPSVMIYATVKLEKGHFLFVTVSMSIMSFVLK